MTKTFPCVLSVHSSNCCSPPKRDCKVSQSSVQTLFISGKRLQYFSTNIFKTTLAEFCQNWPGFVEDMTKNILVCFCSVHSAPGFRTIAVHAWAGRVLYQYQF